MERRRVEELEKLEAICVETEIQAKDTPVSSRLATILDRLHGGCKAMEEIVGTPEGAKDRDLLEAISKVNNVDMFLETIEYRVGELLAQISRLSQWLG